VHLRIDITIRHTINTYINLYDALSDLGIYKLKKHPGAGCRALLKKSVSDSANPYKQSNNFHPAIKTDAQRPITFKEDTSTYTLRNRVKPAQKYDVFALRHILI
jgi:hypothetical protein